jgi:hypothetical protein
MNSLTEADLHDVAEAYALLGRILRIHEMHNTRLTTTTFNTRRK